MLSTGNVFYRVAGEQSAKTLCRLFSREYTSDDGRPYFSLKCADEVDLDEQILLDEAIDTLEIYDDPDPYVYDPPATYETLMCAEYARRAKRWDAMIVARAGGDLSSSIFEGGNNTSNNPVSETQPDRLQTPVGKAFGADSSMREVKDPSLKGTMKTAFISYSWDDEDHREWVCKLAERLRADGVNVSIDRWEAVPGDQLPAFMERAIRDNQFVVIICTPRYKRRSDEREGGVGYEGDIMTAEVMTSRNHRKFIPVLRDGEWALAAPSWLIAKYYINLSGDPYSERDYEDLVRTLLGIREIAPPIGKPMATIISNLTRGSAAPDGNTALDFGDIKITRVIVEDITEPRNDGTLGSALYSIPFALSCKPPSEWVQLFIASWNHPPRFTTMHRPGIANVYGATVTLSGTTIEEVERYHRDTLQLAVAEANRKYRDLRHDQEERRAREEAVREEHRKRIEDASKRIKFD